MKIRYKNCPPEVLPVLHRLDPEIQKAAAAHGLSDDVWWESYIPSWDTGNHRFFRLYAPQRPEAEMGGDYGLAFLSSVDPDEFYWWITRQLPHFA
jgi:hypothetical protein